MSWKEEYRRLLEERVKDYGDWIREYLDFLDRLVNAWWNGPVDAREKYAYHFALLQAVPRKENVIRAKLNAYYAYLVYKGYVTAYRLMKFKYVAGGESIYTWLRMYRYYNV